MAAPSIINQGGKVMMSALMPAACQISFALLRVAQRCAAERAANAAVTCGDHVNQRRSAPLPSLPVPTRHLNSEIGGQVEALACYVASVNPGATSTVLAAATISSTIAVSRVPPLAEAAGLFKVTNAADYLRSIMENSTVSHASSGCQASPAMSLPCLGTNGHLSLEKRFEAFNGPRKVRTSTNLPIRAAPPTNPLSDDRLGKNTPTLVGCFEPAHPSRQHSAVRIPSLVRCSFAASAVQSSWADPAAAMADRIAEPAIALPDHASNGRASRSLAKQFEDFHMARNKVRASFHMAVRLSERGVAGSAASQQPLGDQKDS
ncbi:unnamed protein product [Closterium sp. NIES-53]